MSLPVVAQKSPEAVDLEQGKKYAWCTCGRSESQPFCDGKHKGSEFKPQLFTAEGSHRAYLCACKQTKNGPYCDGSHNAID